jgi:hypothetical protein
MRAIYKLFIFLLIGCLNDSIKAQSVTLDEYFNHETRHDKSGAEKRFHYLWDETDNAGFSVFGNAFIKCGGKLNTLDAPPTLHNLKSTDIYIIVDPDTKKENPDPKYISAGDIKQIAAWVKQGGLLVLMANDSANTELYYFNKLAAKFGIQFNDDLKNHVIDDNHLQEGAIVSEGNILFPTARKIFMKDICSISVTYPAKAVLMKDNWIVIAVAQYGKGKVLAVGDPWLYNEYTNGRLPPEFENDKAANDITKWLIKNISR